MIDSPDRDEWDEFFQGWGWASIGWGLTLLVLIVGSLAIWRY